MTKIISPINSVLVARYCLTLRYLCHLRYTYLGILYHLLLVTGIIAFQEFVLQIVRDLTYGEQRERDHSSHNHINPYTGNWLLPIAWVTFDNGDSIVSRLRHRHVVIMLCICFLEILTLLEFILIKNTQQRHHISIPSFLLSFGGQSYSRQKTPIDIY